MRQPTKRVLRQRGFSILELSVVLACISALVSIAFPAFQRSLNRSHAVEAITVANTIERELVDYYNRNNQYPPYPSGVAQNPPDDPGAGKTQWVNGLPGWVDINFTGEGSYYYRYQYTSTFDATTNQYDSCTIHAWAQLLGDVTLDEWYIYLESGYRQGQLSVESGE